MEESANVSMRMKGIFTISRCVSMFFLFYVAVTHAEFIICCFLFVFDGALKIQNLQRKTAERLKFGFAPYSGIYCCENRGSCVTYLQLTNSSSSCLKVGTQKEHEHLPFDLHSIFEPYFMRTFLALKRNGKAIINSVG